MPSVETVRGAVDVADLGRTYMHEHIFVLNPDVQQNFPEEWGAEEDRIEDAVQQLSALAEAGVKTIVDPTVIGLGRYIPRIRRIAERVPQLNIVAATGLYTYDDVPFYFHYRGPALNEMAGEDVPDPMVDMFVKDIREGIAGTGVKAGLLKCGIDHQGMTPGVERVMRAVAQAHRMTGVPITVHTHPGSETGVDVQRVLGEAGVEPRHVVLGHSGDTTDIGYLTRMAEAGFILGMDRMGINLETTMETRADTVVEICRRGFSSQMVLSQDASCYIDWLDPEVMKMLPQWHYLHIEQDVLPYMLEHGVSDEDITTMLVDTPARYFSSSESY
jgi:phosphotriesterase-related protein